MPRIEIEFGANFEKYMSDFSKAQRETVSGIQSLQNTVSTITGVSVFGYGASQLLDMGMQAMKSAAQLEVARSSFQGTAKDIAMMQKATAGTVAEADLIHLSNQATDLGLSLEQQIILMSLAEDRADAYGGSVEENFHKIVNASEGATKGLKELGIQKAQYDELIEKYVNQAGAKQLDQLDAEKQKWIQVQAVIELTGSSLDNAVNKIQDSADELEAMGVKWQEWKTGAGNLLLDMFNKTATVAENLWGWLYKIGQLPKELLFTIGIDISDEALGASKKAKYGGDNSNVPPEGSMERIAYDINAKKEAKNKEEEQKKKLAAEKLKKEQEELQKRFETSFRSDDEIKKEMNITKARLEGNLSLRERYELTLKLNKLDQELNGRTRMLAATDAAGAIDVMKKGVSTIPIDKTNFNDKFFTSKNQSENKPTVESTKEIGEEWENVIDISQRATSMMSQGLSSVIMRGEKLSNVLKNIGSMFLESGLQFFMSIGLKAGAAALGVPEFLFANGGVIAEPVVGMGLNSRKSYMFGEAGNEIVIPASRYSSGGGTVIHKVYVQGNLTGDMRTLNAGIQARNDIDEQYR